MKHHQGLFRISRWPVKTSLRPHGTAAAHFSSSYEFPVTSVKPFKPTQGAGVWVYTAGTTMWKEAE